MAEPANLLDCPASEGDWLDARFEAFEQRILGEFREQTTRLARWIVATTFAGIVAGGAIAAALSAGS